jgi:hypothetical protein
MNKTDILTKIIVPVAACLLSGFGVWIFSSDWEAIARSKGWVSKVEWQQTARMSEWLPKEECPAFPIEMGIIAPGDGANLSQVIFGRNKTNIYHDIAIKLNRPLSGRASIGLVYNPDGTNDYFFNFLITS